MDQNDVLHQLRRADEALDRYSNSVRLEPGLMNNHQHQEILDATRTIAERAATLLPGRPPGGPSFNCPHCGGTVQVSK